MRLYNNSDNSEITGSIIANNETNLYFTSQSSTNISSSIISGGLNTSHNIYIYGANPVSKTVTLINSPSYGIYSTLGLGLTKQVILLLQTPIFTIINMVFII